MTEATDNQALPYDAMKMRAAFPRAMRMGMLLVQEAPNTLVNFWVEYKDAPKVTVPLDHFPLDTDALIKEVLAAAPHLGFDSMEAADIDMKVLAEADDIFDGIDDMGVEYDTTVVADVEKTIEVCSVDTCHREPLPDRSECLVHDQPDDPDDHGF
jgi:hypothetical protein